MTATDADGFIGLAGQFPREWERLPFWARYRRVKRAADGSEELLSVYRDFGVIRKSDRDDNFNKASDDLTKYQVVRAGDLVINKMKAWQGSVAVSSLDGIVSPAYFVFESLSASVPRFVHFLLRSGAYIEAYRAASKGIRPNQWDLDPDLLRTFPLPLPSTAMQTAIVDFLDRETTEIDAFIADQEELIGLLAERRAATISHAVTKGLDPTVPMKASGVEWLGKMPVGWQSPPLKWRASLQTGSTPKSLEEFSDEPYISWFRPEDLDELGRDSIASRWITSEGARGLRSFSSRSSLVCGIGATLGKVGYVSELAYSNQQITAVSEFAGDARYVFYVLVAARSEILRLSVGNTLPIINNDRLGTLRIPEPPADVAKGIANQLDEQCSELDATIADAKEAIALSRERRAALISAAVTGKIDVREHGAVA